MGDDEPQRGGYQDRLDSHIQHSDNGAGGIIGMESFGASGAVQAVYEKFGITAAQVVKEVEARL